MDKWQLIGTGEVYYGNIKPVTIESVNNGLDYIQDAGALATYGRRELVKRFDDISSPTELKAAAEEWFDENKMRLKQSVTLNAYELKYAGVNTQYLRFMTRVQVEDEQHEFMATYPLTRMEIPLDSPTAMMIELGDERNTLTGKVQSNAAAANVEAAMLRSRIKTLEDGA